MQFWAVVADASKARFFRGRSPNSPLEEFHEMTHEESRRDELDLVTDKPGRFQDESGPEAGPARSSTEPNALEHARRKFASEVADYIDRARAQGVFDHLSIIAEPKFLGKLRKSLASTTADTILEEISKNLTRADEATIRDTLTRLPRGFK
jgi:protein required for attachment to host cells